jgi:hypothetical protein
MEAILERERTVTPEAMRTRVFSEARRSLPDGISDADLERCVDQAVADVWTDQTRVTSFIPVLALREVRLLVEQRKASSRG